MIVRNEDTSYETLTKEIEEAVATFLERVNERLNPMWVCLDSLDIDGDENYDAPTSSQLKQFVFEVDGMSNKTIELSVSLEATLMAFGKPEEITWSVPFVVNVTNGKEGTTVSVVAPNQIIVFDHDIATVYAKHITTKLIELNAFAAQEEQRFVGGTE